MTPGTDERTAPDTASGAVLLGQLTVLDQPPVRLTERAFWRAVAATLVPVPRRRRQ
jgi:hypothetical protein